VSARAAWAGIIVTDLDRSAAWYARELRAVVADRDERWVKLDFPNGSVIELFRGDRSDPGGTFPSYGMDAGPPVMPGYAVEDAAELVDAHALEVSRSLPGWVVVAAPDRLRVVLMGTEPGGGGGLAGFRFTSTAGADQRRFLEALSVEGAELADGEIAVVPVVRCGRSGEVADPDGTPLVLVSR
jgi:catechol 2,3-dioxygenase-like lactoylglutathione lyase family enzyme